jgi:hypothetical protein
MKAQNKSIEWLIEFIDEVLREPGNEWVGYSLLNKIGTSQLAYGVNQHEKILSEIYEYCIAKNVSNQAEQFYKNIPIKDIKSSLMNYYKKMEMNHRKNDYLETALNIYQQIELIVNRVFDSDNCRKLIAKNIDAFAYKDSPDKLIPLLLMKEKNDLYDVDRSQPYFILAEDRRKDYFDSRNMPNIVYKKDKKTWEIKSKFRSVLYFYCLDEKERESYYKFTELYNVWKELSTMRNEVHGNNNNEVKVYLDKFDLTNNHEKAIFKFHGFLATFVLRFERGYKEMEAKVD